MPPHPSSSSSRNKRVHPSPSTPLLRPPVPSPLSQVLLGPSSALLNPEDAADGEEDDGGRTPTSLRPPRSAITGGSGGQPGMEHPTHGSRHRSHPRAAAGASHHHQQEELPQRHPSQQSTTSSASRRPITARSYFPSSPVSPVSATTSFPYNISPFSSPFSPTPTDRTRGERDTDGPSSADYLNGGVGWNVPSLNTFTPALSFSPPGAHTRGQAQGAIPTPRSKTRGRSHTVTAAHPSSPPDSASSAITRSTRASRAEGSGTSSSSPSTSPDNSGSGSSFFPSSSSPIASSLHTRQTSWSSSSKRRIPPSLMHWTRPVCHSELRPSRGVRGGTATLVDGNSIWFFGGYDGRETTGDVWVWDVECGEWWCLATRAAGWPVLFPSGSASPGSQVQGLGGLGQGQGQGIGMGGMGMGGMQMQIGGGTGKEPRGPGPLRAHTAVAEGRNIFVFGGGSGDEFSGELWMLDTVEQIWYLLPVSPPPSPAPCARRAHTSFIHTDYLYIYGGGSGSTALGDLWRVDISLPALARAAAGEELLLWEEVRTFGSSESAVELDEAEGEEGKPSPRGYMSATLVGDVLVVLGGQSGRDGEREGPWADCWVLNLLDMRWQEKTLKPPVPLASHTATLVGMYLFIFGGNDGTKYTNELMMLNLITMQWETPRIRGHPPPERAQHQAILVDSRLWIFGGFDGKKYFDEPYVLDLAGSSWLAAVTEFEVGDEEEGWD